MPIGNLISRYLESVKPLFGDGFEQYKESLSRPVKRALRFNTLKVGTSPFDESESLKRLREHCFERVPFCDSGYYTDIKPSQCPLHAAGLFYMQEASAQTPVYAFKDFLKGNVLDLCSAPGGKGTQAAMYMNGGALYLNETEFPRALVLGENVRRMGIKNAIVTCNRPEAYLDYEGFFDAVIVDAPCSGEGMMRKEQIFWSKDLVDGCVKRQARIVDVAARLVKDGGAILYSTCTFNRRENEGTVERLIDKGFEPVEVFSPVGAVRSEYCSVRLYPHLIDGEGHFYCVLKKPENGSTAAKNRDIAHKNLKIAPRYKPDKGALATLSAFTSGDLSAAVSDGTRIYLPVNAPDYGLNVLQRGVPLFSGAVTKAFALSIKRGEARNTVELSSENALEFLAGRKAAIDSDNHTGDIALACYDGYPLGFATVKYNAAQQFKHRPKDK